MYVELYAAWRTEITEADLGALPFDFYSRIASYLRKIKEENRMLDKKTLKATLLEHEAQHVKRMLHELVWARYKKLVKLTTQTQKPKTRAAETPAATATGSIHHSYGVIVCA